MIRFAANLTMLFKEVPFLDRFQAAADAGFAAVEFLWPAAKDLDAIPKAVERAGVKVVLFNTDAGDIAAGNRGHLTDPAKRDYVMDNFRLALDLAKTINCPRLHPLVGNALPGVPRAKQLAQVAGMFKEMVPLAEAAGIGLDAEVLNNIENPRYLITDTRQMLELLQMIGSPTVKYQYDVYHLQRMEGNVVATLRQHMGEIGHIQIADSPDRHQPGTGELNYRYILAALEELGYKGYVSLEYNPAGTTLDSLTWLPSGRRAECTASELHL